MPSLIRIVLVWGIAAILFFMLLYAILKIQRSQEVAGLDRIFSTPRSMLPSDMNVDTIFPQQVGNFRRIGTIGPYNYDGFTLTHVNISYVNKPDNTGISIVFDTFPHDPVPYFKTGCATEFTPSYRYERLDTTVPYSYCTCATGIFSPFDSITGVAWGNGIWEYRLSGDYQTLIAFLKDYPY